MAEKLNLSNDKSTSESAHSNFNNLSIDQITLQDAKALSREVRDYELGFAKQLERDNGRMEQKEFEAWEDLVSNQLQIVQSKIDLGALDLEQEALARQQMIVYRDYKDFPKTIEVQAGKFYYPRERALRQAITDSDSPSKAEDLSLIDGYYATVIKHLDLKYMTRDEIRDYGVESYDYKRTRAHNDTIKHLNRLNDLARKYHTRPFTVRNFWPSDLRRTEAQTPAIADVMRYDRHLTEAYYATAFTSEVQEHENYRKRQERFGF